MENQEAEVTGAANNTEKNTEEQKADENKAQAQEAESPPAEPAEPVQPQDKDNVRKRIDKIVYEREEARREREEARREAEHWRKLATQTEKPAPEDPGKPQITQFDTFEKYTEALAEWKVETRLKRAQDEYRQHVEKERMESARQAFEERASKVREKFPDYDELFNNAPISENMASTILESEVGPEIAVYLAKNPEVARKIYHLSQREAAREIGRIEAKIDDLLQPKSVTGAKPPLKPVRPKGEAADGLSDDTDIKTWMKNRQKQLGR